jgi:hypothetical protein
MSLPSVPLSPYVCRECPSPRVSGERVAEGRVRGRADYVTSTTIRAGVEPICANQVTWFATQSSSIT